MDLLNDTYDGPRAGVPAEFWKVVALAATTAGDIGITYATPDPQRAYLLEVPGVLRACWSRANRFWRIAACSSNQIWAPATAARAWACPSSSRPAKAAICPLAWDTA
ncbi:hypothetical protein [Streptomyces sp. NPDC054961]